MFCIRRSRKLPNFGLKQENDYDVEISAYVTGRTQTAIYSEAYKILKQDGKVVSSELLSKDTYNAMQRIVHVGTGE